VGKPGRPGPTLDDYLYWQERLARPTTRIHVVNSYSSRTYQITTVVTHVSRDTNFVLKNVWSELLRPIELNTISYSFIKPTILESVGNPPTRESRALVPLSSRSCSRLWRFYCINNLYS